MLLASTLPPVHEWETFYVIIGSSAAALTGLMFVVVALTAQFRNVVGASHAMTAFATPTVVHFSAVLLIAAVITMPQHTGGTLATSIIAIGVIGLAYALFVTYVAIKQKAYEPELEDWICHIFLPIVAYLSLLIDGIVVTSHPIGSLYAIAATALLLLFNGIHNAWDSAVWMVQGANRDGA